MNSELTTISGEMALDLIEAAHRRDILLWVHNNRLHLDAFPAELNGELRDRLATHRHALVKKLGMDLPGPGESLFCPAPDEGGWWEALWWVDGQCPSCGADAERWPRTLLGCRRCSATVFLRPPAADRLDQLDRSDPSLRRKSDTYQPCPISYGIPKDGGETAGHTRSGGRENRTSSQGHSPETGQGAERTGHGR